MILVVSIVKVRTRAEVAIVEVGIVSRPETYLNLYWVNRQDLLISTVLVMLWFVH